MLWVSMFLISHLYVESYLSPTTEYRVRWICCQPGMLFTNLLSEWKISTQWNVNYEHQSLEADTQYILFAQKICISTNQCDHQSLNSLRVISAHPRAPLLFPLSSFVSFVLLFMFLPTKAGQTLSLRFSTSNRRLTKKQPRCSWLAWGSSGQSRRRDQTFCAGWTGSSSAWWVATQSTSSQRHVVLRQQSQYLADTDLF